MNTQASPNATPTDTQLQCVVGIGASAGGLKPLEELFSNLPPTDGVAFVVIQHLSPSFKSVMDEILSRHTDLPVVKAEHDMLLQPDHIYLTTPKTNLTTKDNRFVFEGMQAGELPKPIDCLFQSLAISYGNRCVAIVLSGTGSDGTAGIRDVRQEGGVTIVQDPLSAQFDGMPSNAIATQCVDVVLEPRFIAELIGELSKDPTGREALKPYSVPVDYVGLELVFSLISDRHGINFADYKLATVARRLDRRLHATNHATVESYAQFLLGDPTEVDILFNDLLIGVTRFFRDPDAFAALHLPLSKLVANLGESEELRIWCAGCASGEEAYTLGMLAIEAFERKGMEPRIKILATDIHQPSLDVAARGEYDAECIQLVPEKQRNRFFAKVDKSGKYRVAAELRKLLVFSRHDLVNDPPFSRIRLATCRNMLIYLQSDAQEKSLGALYFSLEPDGLLLLGSSESLGNLTSELDVVNKQWRLFKRNSKRKAATLRSWSAPNISRIPRRALNAVDPERPDSLSFTGLLETYEQILLEYVDCGLLIGSNRRILHVFGEAGRFLEKSSSSHGTIHSMLPKDAAITIGGALARVAKNPAERVVLRNVVFELGNEPTSVCVRTRALRLGSGGTAWLVEFLEDEKRVTDSDHEITISEKDGSHAQLEDELSHTRQSLSATIEELESSNEELVATNEELIAANEELQSTNEELHSVNEEHHTINQEYQRKLQETEELSHQLDSLLSSASVALVFLDSELRIQRFTNKIRDYVDLMPHDIGRPFHHFAHGLKINDLREQLSNVLDSRQKMSIFADSGKGIPVLVSAEACEVVPGSSGLVMTIAPILGPVDRPLPSEIQVGFWEWPDVSRDEMWWSPSCFEMMGFSLDDFPQTMSAWRELIHPDDQHKLRSIGTNDCRFVQLGFLSLRLRCHDGQYRRFELHGYASAKTENTTMRICGTFHAKA